MNTRFWSVLAALLLTTAACAPSNSIQSSDNSSAGNAVDDPEITVEVRSLAQVEELIASHAGKPVVLDLWALW